MESNGPAGKVRGSATQICDKYQNLAREAQTGGNRIMAENFFQHAEHYHRLMTAAVERNTPAPKQGAVSDRNNVRHEATPNATPVVAAVAAEAPTDGKQKADAVVSSGSSVETDAEEAVASKQAV